MVTFGDLARCIFIYVYISIFGLRIYIYKFQFLGSGALYLMFETCQEGIIWHVCSYLRHKHKLLILSRLSDFMICSEYFIIQSKGSISQL